MILSATGSRTGGCLPLYSNSGSRGPDRSVSAHKRIKKLSECGTGTVHITTRQQLPPLLARFSKSVLVNARSLVSINSKSD